MGRWCLLRGRRCRAARFWLDGFEGLLLHALKAHTHACQDGRDNVAFLSNKAQKQVLRPDGLMVGIALTAIIAIFWREGAANLSANLRDITLILLALESLVVGGLMIVLIISP